MITIEQVAPGEIFKPDGGNVTITGDVGDGAQIEMARGRLTILGTVGHSVKITTNDIIKAANIGNHSIIKTTNGFIDVEDIGSGTSCISDSDVCVKNTGTKCLLEAGSVVDAYLIGSGSIVRAGLDIMVKIVEDRCILQSQREGVSANRIGSLVKIEAFTRILIKEHAGTRSELFCNNGKIVLGDVADSVTAIAMQSITASSLANSSILRSTKDGISIKNDIGSNNNLIAHESIVLGHTGTDNTLVSEENKIIVRSQGVFTDLMAKLDIEILDPQPHSGSAIMPVTAASSSQLRPSEIMEVKPGEHVNRADTALVILGDVGDGAKINLPNGSLTIMGRVGNSVEITTKGSIRAQEIGTKTSCTTQGILSVKNTGPECKLTAGLILCANLIGTGSEASAAADVLIKTIESGCTVRSHNRTICATRVGASAKLLAHQSVFVKGYVSPDAFLHSEENTIQVGVVAELVTLVARKSIFALSLSNSSKLTSKEGEIYIKNDIGACNELYAYVSITAGHTGPRNTIHSQNGLVHLRSQGEGTELRSKLPAVVDISQSKPRSKEIAHVGYREPVTIADGDVTITGDVANGARIEVLNGSLTIMGTVGDMVEIKAKGSIKAQKIGDETKCTSGENLCIESAGSGSKLHAGKMLTAHLIERGSTLFAVENISVNELNGYSVLNSHRGWVTVNDINGQVSITAKQSIFVRESVGSSSHLIAKEGKIEVGAVMNSVSIFAAQSITAFSLANNTNVQSYQGDICITNNINSGNKLTAHGSISLKQAGPRNTICSQEGSVTLNSKNDSTTITAKLGVLFTDSQTDPRPKEISIINPSKSVIVPASSQPQSCAIMEVKPGVVLKRTEANVTITGDVGDGATIELPAGSLTIIGKVGNHVKDSTDVPVVLAASSSQSLPLEIEKIQPEEIRQLTGGDIIIKGDVGDGAIVEVPHGSLTIRGKVGHRVTLIVTGGINAQDIGDHCSLLAEGDYLSVQHIGTDTTCRSNGNITVKSSGSKCTLYAGNALYAESIGSDSEITAVGDIWVDSLAHECRVHSQKKTVGAITVGFSVRILAHQLITIQKDVDFSSTLLSETGEMALGAVGNSVTIVGAQSISIASLTNDSSVQSMEGEIHITNHIGSGNTLTAKRVIVPEQAARHNSILSDESNVAASSNEEPCVRHKATATLGLFFASSLPRETTVINAPEPILLPAASSLQSPEAPKRTIPEELLEELLCPITLDIIKDPVLLHGDGHTYEREALDSWLAMNTKKTSPLTHEAVAPDKDGHFYSTNWSARKTIAKYKKLYPDSFEVEEELPSQIGNKM